MKSLDIGGSENPYLRRRYILPKNNLFSIYLHQMLRDDDVALHDHPGANISIILRGGYVEHLFAWNPVPGAPLPPVITKRRRPGQIICRRARMAHRLTLPAEDASVWTIFIFFRKWRDWGFWCGPTARWVPRQEFREGEHGEIIGKGCG